VAVHRLADDGERLGQHVAAARVRRTRACAQLLRAGAELLVGQHLDLGSMRVDLVDDLAVTLQKPLVAAAEDLREDFLNGQGHGTPLADCRFLSMGLTDLRLKDEEPAREHNLARTQK
jgi:hypothetical protein